MFGIPMLGLKLDWQGSAVFRNSGPGRLLLQHMRISFHPSWLAVQL